MVAVRPSYIYDARFLNVNIEVTGGRALYFSGNKSVLF
jgi:hypothetical protein